MKGLSLLALWGLCNSQCVSSDFSCLAGTDVKALNDNLCTQMKGMPGCSLRQSCKPADNFCNENVIYATICQDMPNMSPCSAFRSCQVPSCGLVPTSNNTTKLILSICNEMAMPGCERCNIKIPVCKLMPSMGQSKEDQR
jgi:copper transporter 1